MGVIGGRTYYEFLAFCWQFVCVHCFLAISICSSEVNLTIAGIHASGKLHRYLLANVLRQPYEFFTNVPIGRAITRFSTDVTVVDEELNMNCYEVIESGCIVRLPNYDSIFTLFLIAIRFYSIGCTSSSYI